MKPVTQHFSTDTYYNDDESRLKFWLRSVNQNASWVNKIFLITNNELSEWLDGNNSKLNVLPMLDFMPHNEGITYNPNAVQMRLSEIEGLSERFILYSIDMIIQKPINETVFLTNKVVFRTIILD